MNHSHVGDVGDVSQSAKLFGIPSFSLDEDVSVYNETVIAVRDRRAPGSEVRKSFDKHLTSPTSPTCEPFTGTE